YDDLGRKSETVASFYADGVATTPVGEPTGTPVTHVVFDSLDRETLRELVGPNGESFQRTQTSYGTATYTGLDGVTAAGWLATVTDPNGHATRRVANLLGHVVETHRPQSTCAGGFCVTKFRPDALGRVTEVRDTTGNSTTIVLDGFGRR